MAKNQCEVEMKRLEQPKFKSLAESFTKQMKEIAELLKEVGKPIIEIGKDKIPVAPYGEVQKIFKTPANYLDYICTIIDSPEDIRKLINEPFIKYIADSSKEDVLSEPRVTLAKGGGDCDNLSLVAKYLFDSLGCRQGFDYQAKVIGVGEHGVCVFRDHDGQNKALDQSADIKVWNDIHEASSIFAEYPNDPPFERTLFKEGVMIQIELDPATLKPTHERLIAKIFVEYEHGKFDPSKYLPKDWKTYPMCEVNFMGDVVVFYKEGVLFQEQFPNGETKQYLPNGDLEVVEYGKDSEVAKEIYRDGKLCQQNMKDGRVVIFDSSGGKQVESLSGDKEFYNSDGVRIQLNKKDGNKFLFSEDGKTIKQKNYPETSNIRADVYFPDGEHVERRVFRAKETSDYKVIIFDTQGNWIKRQTWDGKVEVAK